MIVYVFDKRIPGTPRTSSRESVTDTANVIIMADDSVQTIVNKITRAAESERSIWLMRIVCHGEPGRLLLGQGVDSGNARLFSPLAAYFTPGGRGIELHACNVASATTTMMTVVDARTESAERTDRLGTPGGGTTGVGPAFIAALARATGVNVVGAYDLQFYDREYRFEGRGTTTVEPGGTTTTTIAGTGG